MATFINPKEKDKPKKTFSYFSFLQVKKEEPRRKNQEGKGNYVNDLKMARTLDN
ncbi:MAG: hypothetical protein F6K39_16955 [Okeania sp. SIO3B3]|nr:hypothetical protein [Okeania sp. SIO3B3]